ncbi:Gp15 family bacteriophage protein [Gordonibacter urolithinfaciens]|uniref:Gp15 family bacteriophage protein n=1 Tax=Gordonibacter urolithinfaciens TaxID=1335613 RepID=UPI000F4B2D20|nr:Gp15 family bacteriophage protein [Gordonibacter urolithinfaciens]ROT90969.1 hypothetical protein DMP13_07435 [Gordonibacter urolithinfaciens]
MSIIGVGLPSSVDVGGRAFPINTSHHCGVRVGAILDDPAVADPVARAVVLRNYFGTVPTGSDADALFVAAMRFYRRGEDPPPQGKHKKPRSRVFDWEADANRLVADFQRFYGVDVTDQSLHIHWWRFMALLEGLPGDTSLTMQAISVRARDLSDCKSQEERQLLRAQKKAIALPPRTAAEVTLDI